MADRDGLYRCIRGRAHAGVVVKEGRVHEVAPILWRLVHKTQGWGDAKAALRRKGWQIEKVLE